MSQNQRRILVIDDEPEIVEMLLEILTSENYLVQGIISSEQAIDKVKDFNPELILTDISMPGKTGLDILDEVRKQNPTLPVVLISGFINKEILTRAKASGASGFIEKPFDLDNVIQCCHNVFAK